MVNKGFHGREKKSFKSSTDLHRCSEACKQNTIIKVTSENLVSSSAVKNSDYTVYVKLFNK